MSLSGSLFDSGDNSALQALAVTGLDAAKQIAYTMASFVMNLFSAAPIITSLVTLVAIGFVVKFGMGFIKRHTRH